MKYIVYVKLNENGYITNVNSSAFLSDTAEWTEIDSGYGDKYHHAQGNYFSKSIMTMNGAYQYKLINDIVIECTAEEIAAQELSMNQINTQPTQSDIFEAQLMYTAMMTGTLLEGGNEE